MSTEITVTRTFAAPRATVYRVFTEVEPFARWWGTDAVPVDVSAFDVTEGGAIAAVMHLPDGTDKPWIGAFRELRIDERVVFDITDEPENPDLASVEIDLVDADGGTQVTIRQETPGWPDDARAGLVAGYNAFLDTVERILVRGL